MAKDTYVYSKVCFFRYCFGHLFLLKEHLENANTSGIEGYWFFCVWMILQFFTLPL